MTAPIPDLIFTGLAFGCSNGISPGPLSLLTICETLRGGTKEGFKVACAPLMTDSPIIIACIFVLSQIPNREITLALISLAGAAFLLLLAYKSITFNSTAAENANISTAAQRGSNPFVRGITTNLLNPYPYLFWITVGVPYMTQLLEKGVLSVVIFFFAFYLGMFAVKFTIILLVARGRRMLSSYAYLLTIRATSVFLAYFAFRFIEQANFLWSVRL